MIKIGFTQFWKDIEIERKKIRPLVHRIEFAESFWFFYKHSNGWKYCTVITLQEILDNAENAEIDQSYALEMFYNYFITGTKKVLDCPEITQFISPEDTEEYYSSLDKSIDPGQDVIEEAEDYADFFLKQVELWKQKTTKQIESMSFKSYTRKNFGGFLRIMMNTINSRPFMRVVRRFVKQSMTEGLESAEDEVGVDIGINPSFNDRVTILENQQLNGYTINGKMWYGIKGATKEMHMRILRQIDEDVKNKSSKAEMIKHIQKIFDGVGKAQAERIARTETNRFINEGKLNGFKESKIPGKKAWSVVPVKCCDICNRFGKLYFTKGIDYDQTFKDPLTGKEYQYPPAHPHCRCVIEYRKS